MSRVVDIGGDPNWAGPALRRAFAAAGDAQARPLDNSYWLLPGLILAGEHPSGIAPAITRSRLAALIDAGIRHFVDLTASDDEIPPYRDLLHGVAERRDTAAAWTRFAIADYSIPDPPTMRRVLALIDAALATRTPLYLHCHGGIGRTGTVAGCLLVESGFDGDEALDLIATKWSVMAKRARAPRSPETEEQRDFVRRWTVMR